MIRARLLILLGAAAIAAAACTTAAESTTSTAPVTSEASTTTTTAPPEPTTTTTMAPLEVPGTASASLDPAVVDRMRRELAELMVEAEQVRGLPFLSVPTVVILDEPEFTERVANLIAEDLDEEELEIDSRYLSLIGMLPADTDLYAFYIDLYSEQVAGFYDGDEREMVVPAAADGFTPLQRITVVHELVHALTDQHFEFNEPFTQLIDEGNGDEASALLAVIEGDAQRTSFVYLEALSPSEMVAAAVEARDFQSPIFDAAPRWIRADLLFPYEQGLAFNQAVIAESGLKGVDDAYVDPPTTTEQILDHDKFVRGEGPRTLAPLTAELEGWEVYDEGSFGEWGLRLLLGESIPPGEATQAAAGWGNDHYRVYSRGDDVAFALHYIGDAERDAEELADALIAHIATSMGGGPAAESGGGLLYDQAGIYVFIDRVDDELFFIASTNNPAGTDLRGQLGL